MSGVSALSFCSVIPLNMSAHHSCQHLPSPLPAFHIKLSSQRCLTFCIRLSIPVWIPLHLILTSQTPTLRYPSPPPPPIHPVLLLLAWLIAETEPILCRAACKASRTAATLLPPHTQPLCALITPRCKGIISGRDQILKHDGSVLVFKWSWSCWFLIRGAEDA